MKETMLLYFLILSTSSILAQDNPKEPIIGLGEFHFGMTMTEVSKAIETHTSGKQTECTRIRNTLAVTNLILAGHAFDYCFLTFEEDRLSYISFTKYCKKNDKDPKVFWEVLTILENDYGSHQLTTNEVNLLSWLDTNDMYISLSKDYDEINKRYIITITSSKKKL